VTSFKVIVIDGYLAVEVFISSTTTKDKFDVITSKNVVTAVEWSGPSVKRSTFEVTSL